MLRKLRDVDAARPATDCGVQGYQGEAAPASPPGLRRGRSLHMKGYHMSADSRGLAQELNLSELRAACVRATAPLIGLVGYGWWMWTVNPHTGASAQLPAWLGSVGLMLGPITALWLRRDHPRVAQHLPVWSAWLAVLCALVTFRRSDMAYLFIVPAALAAMLLGQGAALLLTVLADGVLLAAGPHLLGLSPGAADLWLPASTIALVAATSWLSARNLHIALDWVWSGYERASYNERLAREREAELRRVLKALDEATYRLERANHMLTLARDQAEEARRLKQHFAQTISHELRTPLNLIVGYTELMARSPDYYGAPLPPAYLRDLSVVYRSACHLQSLVNDVLDLARIEAAQMAISREETDPAMLVREAAAIARGLIESRGLELRVEIEPELPRLWLDHTRIRQVLFNLLNNAARFTEQGSVTVRASRSEDGVLFQVADTGIGIPEDQIPRLFEEFGQLESGTKRRHDGVGLGLAISRGFVELHGGRIWAESKVGRGSTFYVHLPLRRPDTSAPVQVQSLDHTSGASRILLVVTRNAAAAALLARYVRGGRTMVVHDLETAKRVASQVLPHTVVIDSSSETLDAAGLERVARTWGLPHAIFVACPFPDGRSCRSRLDAQAYLVKPITQQHLWDVLRRFGGEVNRILLVDDDRDFARLVARLLDNPLRRYQVTAVHSGRECLAAVSECRPDLILLDLRLPDMSGVDVLAALHSHAAWREIPVVVVSAQDEVDPNQHVSHVVVVRGSGMAVGEVVRWVQVAFDWPGPGLATPTPSTWPEAPAP